MEPSLQPDPADDVFDGRDDQTSLSPREHAFQERVAHVCQKMKISSLHESQIQVFKALERGQNICYFAATGSGKSLPFQSFYWMLEAKLQQKASFEQRPTSLPKRKITFVFIPLSAIAEEQVDNLRILHNDPNAAFFFDQSKSEAHHLDNIFNGKYKVVYMSPEKAVDAKVMEKLWAVEAFRGRVNLIAVDEAHLVHDWYVHVCHFITLANNSKRGDKFRKAYSQLGEIRRLFGTSIPWLLCSATLPRAKKDQILSSIGIEKHVEIMTNLDRPNLYYNILQGGGVQYKSGPTVLDFLFDDCNNPTSTPLSIPKTLIYFENILVLQAFQAHLRDIVPSHLKAQGIRIVESYYATRTTDTKKHVRLQFFIGDVCRIICTTEAFGMGMDIRDITRVFQWGPPKSVSSLIQRFGRAARDKNMMACCTLVLSKEYFKITDPKFVPTNGTQRKMQQNHPEKYELLRSVCLRKGFLAYLGVADQYKCPAPGECCSHCSIKINHPTAVRGSRGLCNPEKEKERILANQANKLPKTDYLIVNSALEELKLWRDLVTNASLRGLPSHDLWRPDGCIPDLVLRELARGTTAIMDHDWPLSRVSSWYGWKHWGDADYPEYQVTSFISKGWETGKQRIHYKKDEKKKVKAQKAAAKKTLDGAVGRGKRHKLGPAQRVSTRPRTRSGLGPRSPTPVSSASGGRNKTPDPTFSPLLSRPGISQSRRESNGSIASNTTAASASSAAVSAAGPNAWHGLGNSK